jgi:hypothetical protein
MQLHLLDLDVDDLGRLHRQRPLAHAHPFAARLLRDARLLGPKIFFPQKNT